MSSPTRSHALTLVEFVVVVVIITVIAAIAIPQPSRGARNGAATGVEADLAVLRNAIALYQLDHEGALPTVDGFVEQMTMFSNVAGDSFSTTPDLANEIVFGPYLKRIPPLPVGQRNGSARVAAIVGPLGVGWIYNEANGDIRANALAGEVDRYGVEYKAR